MTISATGHSYIDVETGTALDAWFPVNADPVRSCLAQEAGILRSETVELTIDLDEAPTSLADTYLRLQLISRREIQPNDANLDGMFGLLTNVAWTTAGPALPSTVDHLRTEAAKTGHHVGVFGLDKMPRMTDYVIPEGVRIANANRVRLGAHLAEGTTVMHEGFVNFNAGTLGPAMVEGRISASVTVGAHSDVGGGASIMGTLSGGGKEKISVGEHCLIGANGGLGISIGNNVTIEAGLYLTAGTKVTTPDGDVVPARELSGISDVLFVRNSTTGIVELRPGSGQGWSGINEALHKN